MLVVVVAMIGANPIDDGDAAIDTGKEQQDVASVMELRGGMEWIFILNYWWDSE